MHRIDNIDVHVNVKAPVLDNSRRRLRIGDLAELTGVSPRALRYYEEQGLLAPERGANRYRVYERDMVDTVRVIRTLLTAGLSTDMIAALLPCARDGLPLQQCAKSEEILTTELNALDQRIAALTESRRLLAAVLNGTVSSP